MSRSQGDDSFSENDLEEVQGGLGGPSGGRVRVELSCKCKTIPYIMYVMD